MNGTTHDRPAPPDPEDRKSHPLERIRDDFRDGRVTERDALLKMFAIALGEDPYPDETAAENDPSRDEHRHDFTQDAA